MIRLLMGLLVIGFSSLGFTGCRDDSASSTSDGATQRAAAGERVSWPAMEALDAAAHEAEIAVQSGDREAMERVAGELVEAGDKLASDPIPDNVRNRDQLSVLIGDMETLVNPLREVDELADEALSNLLATFHPVVLMLAETAGMPHDHARHHGHSHDHDYDHDHDDHSAPNWERGQEAEEP